MPAKRHEQGKQNTSLRLDKRTLKALKLRALEGDTSVQKIIEQLIDNHLADAGQPLKHKRS